LPWKPFLQRPGILSCAPQPETTPDLQALSSASEVGKEVDEIVG